MFDRPEQESQVTHAPPKPRRGHLQSLWRSGTDALDCLSLIVFPARCGACAAVLAQRTRERLCAVCLHQLVANDGRRCQACDVPLRDPTIGNTCQRCTAVAPAFRGLRAPWLYGGALAELIVATKFHGREDLAHALGRMLAPRIATAAAPWHIRHVVPIPLGCKRRRQRGFNQAAVLARHVAQAMGVSVCHGLRRCRETQPQSDLDLAERRANMREAFAPRRRLGGSTLLIDDVVTSGETVNAATTALLAAGATEVWVAAVARAHV